MFKQSFSRLTMTLFVAGLGLAASAQVEPSSYTLPGDAVFPEGVAYDESGGSFYVGSTSDGTIFRGDVASGEVSVFAEGAQPTAIGMKVDEAGRLWVAGGPTGQIFVYDTKSGDLLQTFSTPEAENTFINDVAIASGNAYFTDSMRPVLFRVSASGDSLGELEPWLDLSETPIQYQQGFNLNGIASTEDGQYLIVVQSNTGRLFRVGTETKEVTEIDLGGETVMAGDGLLLDGETLYVVRNAAGVIVPVELSEDYLSGTVGEGFTDPSFIFPTTIAKAGDTLLVVNSQFNNRGEGQSPQLPFTVSRIALPE